jgi:competence protein ComEC
LAVLGGIFGRTRGAFLAIAGIALYVLLVGADAAAQRAGAMGALYVLAIALGRQSTALITLFASVFLMTALNPLTLGDVGFQLSFMATLGLILFTTPIQHGMERLLSSRLPPLETRKAMGLLSGALIVTLAAQIMTLPLAVYHFGRLSPISLLANFLILPAQPPIMMGGMATLIGGWAWEPISRVLAVIPLLFLTYTTAVVQWMASVPWASVETGAVGRTLALVYYGVLFGGLRRPVGAPGPCGAPRFWPV